MLRSKEFLGYIESDDVTVKAILKRLPQIAGIYTLPGKIMIAHALNVVDGEPLKGNRLYNLPPINMGRNSYGVSLLEEYSPDEATSNIIVNDRRNRINRTLSVKKNPNGIVTNITDQRILQQVSDDNKKIHIYAARSIRFHPQEGELLESAAIIDGLISRYVTIETQVGKRTITDDELGNVMTSSSPTRERLANPAELLYFEFSDYRHLGSRDESLMKVIGKKL